jgi:isopropylmalate/homocitrate/citramalate synthase
MKIIDVTLRDGSYHLKELIFSKKITVNYLKIASSIKSNIFKYIEFGHGLGKIDKSYIEIFREIKKIKRNAQLGVFIQPKFFNNKKIIKKISFENIDFVRLGVDSINDYHLDKCIKFFLKKKIKIFLFLMKIHNITPKEACLSLYNAVNKYKIKDFILADSLGVLSPIDIDDYKKQITQIKKNIKIGFHPHDHFGRSFSNYFCAKKNNYNYIDVSLQGIGRAAGNLSAEYVLIDIFYNKNNKNLKKIIYFLKIFKNLFEILKIKKKINYKYIISSLYNKHVR